MEVGCPNCEKLGWVGKGELLRSTPRKRLQEASGNYGLREQTHTNQVLRVETDSDEIHCSIAITKLGSASLRGDTRQLVRSNELTGCNVGA